jgi:hypothetical protein
VPFQDQIGEYDPSLAAGNIDMMKSRAACRDANVPAQLDPNHSLPAAVSPGVGS